MTSRRIRTRQTKRDDRFMGGLRWPLFGWRNLVPLS